MKNPIVSVRAAFALFSATLPSINAVEFDNRHLAEKLSSMGRPASANGMMGPKFVDGNRRQSVETLLQELPAIETKLREGFTASGHLDASFLEGYAKVRATLQVLDNAPESDPDARKLAANIRREIAESLRDPDIDPANSYDWIRKGVASSGFNIQQKLEVVNLIFPNGRETFKAAAEILTLTSEYIKSPSDVLPADDFISLNLRTISSIRNLFMVSENGRQIFDTRKVPQACNAIAICNLLLAYPADGIYGVLNSPHASIDDEKKSAVLLQRRNLSQHLGNGDERQGIAILKGCAVYR